MSKPFSSPGTQDRTDGRSKKPAQALKKGDSGGRGRSRISQAVQKIQLEAMRALARETPPRKKSMPQPDALPPETGLAVGLSENERATLVEVTDAFDRPLVCMPPETALRQGLRIRTVAVALRTVGNKVLLGRRRNEKLGRQGLWDVGTGFVLVGESSEDAVLRFLAQAGLRGMRPVVAAAEADEASGLNCRLTLFIVDLPPGLYPWSPAWEALEVDADELEGLVRDAADLLTPELIWAAGTGILFKPDRKAGAGVKAWANQL